VLVAGRGTDNSPTLYGLAPAGGAVVWSVPTLVGEAHAVAVREAVVYVSGDQEVAAYEEVSGKQLWKQVVPDVGGRGDYLLPEPPVVGPRYLYVASNIGRVWALEVATGLAAGSINLRDQDRNLELSHNPILSNGRLYVVSANQSTLYQTGP
jgi:outer membrane protein assembly factor BamB